MAEASAVRQPSIPGTDHAGHPMRRAGDLEPPPLLRAGWVPGHDESSPETADQRARMALRGVEEVRVELGDVKGELAAIARQLGALVRVFKVLGVLALPVAVAIVVDLARSAVHWLSTLHH